MVGSVNLSSWLGDANLSAVDDLVVPSTAGDAFVVTPNSSNASLNVSLGGTAVGSIVGGGKLSFIGSGGTVTINGESGAGSDVFTINDTSVSFGAADGLAGTTISFAGTGFTRNVDAQGVTNTFNIVGPGVSGPSGALVGDSGSNAFVFSGSSKLIGNIQGGGSSTLSYAAYGSGVTVKLGNGTNGTATGVSGTVTGITALIGSSYNDTLNAGTVANVAISGGSGTNTISGTGSGDSVVESIASSYTLTNASLTGTGAGEASPTTSAASRSLRYRATVPRAIPSRSAAGRGGVAGRPGRHRHGDGEQDAGFTLTNTLLSSTDGMTLGLTGIATANLAATSAGKTFTISGWTGGGSLSDTATGIVTASESGGSPSQHVADIDRCHVAGLERDHDRQPHRHQFGRQHLHHQRLDRKGHADRPRPTPWWTRSRLTSR